MSSAPGGLNGTCVTLCNRLSQVRFDRNDVVVGRRDENSLDISQWAAFVHLGS
jgi:hypothetical protein